MEEARRPEPSLQLPRLAVVGDAKTASRRPRSRDRVGRAEQTVTTHGGDREAVRAALDAARRANPRRAGRRPRGTRKPRKQAVQPEPEPEPRPARVRLGGPPAMERARKGQPVLNTSAAKSSRTLLRLVCKQLDWWEESLGNDKGTVFWLVSNEDIADRLPRRKPSQRIARYAGMYELCKKVPFARMMRAAQQRRPEDFTFWPRTWIFPDDQGAGPSAANFKAGPLIFKPDEGCQGDGIYLLSSATDLDRNLMNAKSGTCVVQRYLADPMLLPDGAGNGLKFDLRLYVLVSSLSPLRVFLCREGLVRVCSTPYEAPSKRNAHKLTSHLTNYSINKYEATYEHHDDPTDGSKGTKRSLSAVMTYLASLGYNTADLWDSTVALVARTAEAMAATLLNEEPAVPFGALWPPPEGWVGYEKGLSAKQDTSKSPEDLNAGGFHVLGFDVMYCKARPPKNKKGAEDLSQRSGEGSDKYCAHLLEVNCNPSLGVDSVYPCEGPAATRPVPPPASASWAAEWHAAMEAMPYKGQKPCKCRSHHRPHLHAPCAIDLNAKTAAVSGAMAIVRTEVSAKKQGVLETTPAETLCEGTSYCVVVDSALPSHAHVQEASSTVAALPEEPSVEAPLGHN